MGTPNHRKRRTRVIANLLGLLVPLAIVECLYLSASSRHWLSDTVGTTEHEISQDHVYHQGRQLLQVSNSSEQNCTPRAIHQFPPDFMTLAERRHGGVVFHITLSLYLFVAIAIACDDFFVPALEKICLVMDIQPDVAGATFMAAGSSAPEFFAAVIGIFFAKSDIGLSTIVGSAVFNMLLVNAVVGMFTGAVIFLNWWPVFRDCTYYMLSVVILIIVMSDDIVHWYEALVMVLLYVLYVALMYFNGRVEDYLMGRVTCCPNHRTQSQNGHLRQSNTDKEPLLRGVERKSQHTVEYGSDGHRPETSETGEGKDNIPNPTLARVDSQSICSSIKSSASKRSVTSSIKSHSSYGRHRGRGRSRSQLLSASVISSRLTESFESPLTFPDGCWRRFLWIIMLPITFLMTFTTPDFRRGGCWAKLYVLTFVVSCAWIAGLSYVLVWMVTIVGDTLNIPDTVMGITLLAIGTSVPDAVASLIVAKDGFGDMAVSNSVGSNVFDILLCLGLPWLIQTGMISPGSQADINSKGLTYATITLIGSIVFLLGGLCANKWRLDKKFGAICLVMYVVATCLACLCELNVFGHINQPMCPY